MPDASVSAKEDSVSTNGEPTFPYTCPECGQVALSERYHRSCIPAIKTNHQLRAELARLRGELEALRARRCDGCRWWMQSAIPDKDGLHWGNCDDDRRNADVRVVSAGWVDTREDYSCAAWEARA